jgi:hypothetical protein
MPRGDRTGPQGQGPMTGRGRGKCNSKNRASESPKQGVMGSGRKASRGWRQGSGQAAGRGAGRGSGQGRGRRS